MEHTLRTAFYERHVALGARITEFAGWDMPLYFSGIFEEHLATRKRAGLFDVSHMGRFVIRGAGALDFLQHALTNNAAALEVGRAQYTLIPNEHGGAIDDAYLYRFLEDEYLLVVNASNREKDWSHLEKLRQRFPSSEMEDRTEALTMLSLQGPLAKEILAGLMESGHLPEPMRNQLSICTIAGTEVFLARTGYTGEPLCFELFVPPEGALRVYDLLLEGGAVPVGLGARDTLRLEASLPLYGHELGLDPEDREIPIFASDLARFAVSFSPLKGEFVGRGPLEEQFEALKRIMNRDYSFMVSLPRRVVALALTGKGIARAGARVVREGRPVGYVTSGTMVPYWMSNGVGIESRLTDETGKRAIALGLLDSDLVVGDGVEIEVRGKGIAAEIVEYHLRSEAPPFARAIVHEAVATTQETPQKAPMAQRALSLLEGAIANTLWRQRECINLIPSEQTPSPWVRRLSVMDPVGRYAEHKQVKALRGADVFYYQGTDFIAGVEELLVTELREYLGCSQVETKVVSGQMANAAVFSAMVDFLNRADRKREQRRMGKVMNHHIVKGGHLSSQPMGALRDYVARDPETERPAVVNFPVLVENPFQVDLKATRELLAQHRPELVILGKSMTLHREPVAEVRTMVDELGIDCVVMYDMAHVLGLVGPYFQRPFDEGADLVTGSTHKTFFGTQRGIIASDMVEQGPRYPLWEAVERRTFPGSVSNHHLGSLLGLLMAAYEMNCFKDSYQRAVVKNAKAFARHLVDCRLNVAGDPEIGYTETHQVIVKVGYAAGPEVANRLEQSNIIVNYQATPEEEGFTASGALRMGVSEMTRFGMAEDDFAELAQLMADVVLRNSNAKDKVTAFRQRFLDMHYCFSDQDMEDRLQQLQRLV